MRLKGIISIICLIFLLLTSCSNGSSGGGDEPTPTPASIEILTSNPTVSSDAASIAISLETNADWIASSNQSWCTVSPTSGKEGSNTLTITCEENLSYDERNATITIRCGNVSKNITVTQKQKDALLVTSDKIEMTSDGGEAKIEVKTNLNYEVSVEESAKDWISIVSTRALNTYNVTLNISETNSVNKREGKVIIYSGDKKEVVTVYQQGYEASMVLTPEDVTVSSEGDTVKVELQSNVNVEVDMPNVGWIKELSTRAMSSYTYYYVISKNEEYDVRSAKIIYKNTDSNLSKTVIITQMQRDAIIVAQNSYDLSYEKQQLSFSINTNVDFTVTTSASWITSVSTRGLVSKELTFDIGENTLDNTRSGTIVLTRGNLKQVITVYQNRKSAVNVTPASFVVKAEGGSISFKVTANCQYNVQIADAEWITQASVSEDTYTFVVASNIGYEERSAKILVINNETGDVLPITVTQEQRNTLDINQESFILDEDGGNVLLQVSANIEYTVQPEVNWITETTTRGITTATHIFKVASLPEDEDSRTGIIKVFSASLGLTDNVTVQQIRELRLNETEVELFVGKTQQLTLTNRSQKTVTWSSSNSSVAMVSASGLVKAIGRGSAVISATNGDKTVNCTVTVKYEDHTGGGATTGGGYEF